MKRKKSDILHTTNMFTVFRARRGVLIMLNPDQKRAWPRQRLVSEACWQHLRVMDVQSFNGSCILDLGIGVFANR